MGVVGLAGNIAEFGILGSLSKMKANWREDREEV